MQGTHHEQPKPLETIAAGTAEVYVEFRSYADSSYKIEETHIHDRCYTCAPKLQRGWEEVYSQIHARKCMTTTTVVAVSGVPKHKVVILPITYHNEKAGKGMIQYKPL